MKTLLFVYVALVFLALSSCGKSNETPQQATVPPLNGDCITNPGLCQAGIYNVQGYQPYVYNGGYNAGYAGYSGYYNGPFYYMDNSAYLCNCGTGYLPTYNSYAGLGCVQQTSISAYNYAFYSWGANNSQWTNIPQISNHTGYSNSGCYNGVVQSCLTDQPSTCGIGYSCRAQSASSRLGLCISNSATTNGGYGPVIR